MSKIIKTAAALAIGASVVTAAVAPVDASAANKYKVQSGKLVVVKTGKVATGTVTFNKKVYKKGVLYTGVSKNVYYKKGVKATGTYKGAYYVKGVKKATTGTYNKAYYVKGKKVVTTGLYNKQYFKDGKKATGTYKGAYYVNGTKKVTTGTYNKAYYVKGKKVVATGTYNEAYYVKGEEKVTTGTYNKAYYVDGVKKITTGLLADQLYVDGVLNSGYTLYDTKLYKDAAVNVGFASFEGQVYKDEALADGTFEYEGKEEAFEAGIKVGAKVSSVEEVSATQIKVTFNKTVDAATVLTDVKDSKTVKANVFTVKTVAGVANAITNAEVKGKTITLTLTTAISDENLVIVDGLKTADKETVARYSQVVKFAADTKAPSITSTEQVSASTTKVEFSEALSTLGTVSFKTKDGKEVDASTVGKVFTAKDSSVVFDLSAAKLVGATEVIADGTEVVVTFIGAQDIALNLMTPNPATATIKKVAKDDVAATVASATQTGAKEVTVKFDKAVKELTTADLANLTVGGVAATGIEKVSATEYKLTFDAALEGIKEIKIAKGAIVNVDGKEAAADYTKLVTFVKDAVAPKATSKIVTNKEDGKEYLELTFDKDIELGNGAVSITGSYTLDYIKTDLVATTAKATYANIDADTKLPTDKKVILVPLAASATAAENLAVEGASYALKVTSTDLTSVSDIAIADVETTVTRGKDIDVEAPKESTKEVVTSVAVAQNGTNTDEVAVTFTFKKGEKLDGATATNIANYSVANAEIESATLAAAKEGTDVSTQVVTLKLKKNSNTFTGVRTATVKNVKLANSTEVMTEKSVTTDKLAENVRPTVLSAEITASKVITVKFSEKLDTINKDAFIVKVGTDVIKITETIKLTDTTATITLVDELTAEQLAKAITVESAKDADGKVDTDKFVIKDTEGNLVEDFAAITVVKP